MDPANISWLESNSTDSYWETDNRRSYLERDCLRWEPDSETLLAMSDDNEDVGNDIRRRERLAEVMYEC